MKRSIKLLLIGSLFILNGFLLKGQTTYTSATSGRWSDATTWIGGVVPGSTDNAIIATGTIVTLFGSDATINNLTIEPGGVVNADDRTLTVNGKFIVDGSYTAMNIAANDLIFNGDTLGGTGTIKVDYANRDLIIGANTLILSTANLKVYGNVVLGNSVTLTNEGAIDITGNLTGNNPTTSIWTNSDDSYLAIGGSLLSTGVLNASSAGNTVEYNNFGDQSVILPSAATYHNLKLRGAGNKDLLGVTNINGNIEIYNSATFESNNYNIEIKGNWTNYSEFEQGTSRVTFSGTGDQTISNPMTETFYNFRLNKSSGEIILENDLIIQNILSMVTGVINSSGNILTLGTGTATGQLGSLSYFGGYIKGKFRRWINNTGTHEFPVGNENAQRLLININGISTGGTLMAEFIAGDPGNNGLPLDDAGTTVYNTFVEGYWTIDDDNGFSLGATDNYNLQLSGLGFTSFPIDNNTRILTRTDDASDWQAEGSHLAGSGVTARRNGLTTLPAHFAFGDDTDCSKPVTSAITGSAEVCAGQTGVTYSVTDNPPNTYQWTITGGVQASGGSTNSITVDWDVAGTDNASVTVVESNTCSTGDPVTLPVIIHSVPPESITGETVLAEYSTGVAYSVPSRSGYTYQWSITGGSQVSGGNTNSITVDWGATGTGNVSVIAELPGCPQAPAIELEVRLYGVIESIQTGDWDDPGTWDCACIPLPTDNVRINDGHTVTLPDADDTEINNLIIESNGILNYNTRPFLVHGDFIVDGTYQGGGDRDFTLDGLDTEIGGTGTITGGLSIPSGNKVLPATSTLTINAGDISMGTSVFVTNNGDITVGGDIIGNDASTTWVNSDNSVLELTGDLLTTGTLRAFAQGNLVDYNGADQTIKTPFNSVYYNLSSSGSGTKTLSNSITIQGDLLIDGTSTLDASLNNYSISIAGDWTNNGATFDPRTSTVIFNGTADQTITGVENYYNMIYNNTGGDLVLAGNVVVGNNLRMAGRNIITGSNIITLGTDAANIGSLTYVSGIVAGRMERWINSFGNTIFPVGITTSYQPASLYVNLLNSPGSVIAEFLPVDPGSAGLPLIDGTTVISYQFTEGHWNFIAANGFDVANFNIDLQANNFTSYPLNINSRILKRTNNLNWLFDGNHATGSPPNIYREFLVTGISSLGTQFGIGYACAPFTIDAIITEPTCYGAADGAIDITPSGGASPYTFLWLPGGQTTEDISGLTAGNYSVEVTDVLGCVTPELFNVSQPNDIVVDYLVIDVICAGDNNGAIDISVSGGTAPYTYSWTTADGSGLSPSDEDQTGLTDGTYTVTIIDDNGCTGSEDIVVAVADATPPVIICPGGLSAECDISEQPAYITYAEFTAAGGTATDNCDIDPDSFILLSESTDGNTCPEIVTRTYQIFDVNGNSETCTQIVTIDDLTPPTASNPVPIAVECSADVPAPDILVVTDEADNCTATPTVAFVSDVSDGNSCPEVITRTYSVTDDCGNSINVTQTITVNDITAPTASNPVPVAVECSADVPAPDILVVTDEADNCTATPTVAFVSDVSDGNSCPEVITRTYSVTDDCGNSINVTQTITINDITAPTASNPAPVNVECPGDVPVPDITVVTDEADNCTATPTVAFVGDVSDGNTCPEIITRTYSVTDECGNSINVTQTITVNDITAPTASNPVPIAVECSADVPVPDITVVTDAADNCTASPIVAFVSDVSDGNTCPEIITRTYSVTDECGNSANVTQTITVNDITDPVITGCPSDITVPADGVTCDAVVSWTEPTASDNCSLADFTGSHVPGATFSIGTTTVTYTATDDCGNTAICTFNVNVVDNEAPVITTCATDRTVPADSNCEAIMPDLTVEVVATDNCSPGVIITQLPASGTIISGGITTVTLTATDGSGNSTDCFADVIVIDGSDPVLAVTDTTVYIGAGNIATIDSSYVWDALNSFDNCGITSVTIDINTFDCSMLGDNTVNITAYDAAGNSAAGSATVTVSDTNTVVADAGPDDDICITDVSYTLNNASVVNGTVLWGTTGDGVFDDPALVNPTYTLGSSDVDSVKLYMDVIPVIGCSAVSDTMKLVLSEAAVADAGADDAICASETAYTITDASSSGGTVLWTSSGDGSFDDETLDNPVYTLGTGDIIAGSVTLTMTVTGSGSCGEESDDKIITIYELPAFIVDEHSDITCNGLTDGVLRISGSGGLAPYMYSINGAPYQASGDFTALSAGDYDLSVIDDNGCQNDTTITIIEPEVFNFTLDNVTHNSCYGSDDASISITIIGGTQPYVINWTGPDGFTSTEEDLINLSAGLYSLNLTDANSCNVFTLDTLVTEPSQILITLADVSDYYGYGVSCYGATNGYIEVDIGGGTGVLTASWEGPGGFVSSDEDIYDLEAGDYTLTVTDETGCSETYEVSLTEPDEINISYYVTDASCPDVADGSIDLTITGGVTPYTVIWDDGPTTEDRLSVYAGDYTVDVTDANGCTEQAFITVDVIGINCLEVPEVITPGVVDGKNDVLKIRNISLYPNAEIKIFNRWGKLIYSAKNLEDNQWDGTYQGRALPVDSYHYILDLGDGSTPRTGIITIIR